MKVRTLLFRKGIFTRLDSEESGINPLNYECVYLWRRVLDEMLIGLIGTNSSAVDHSMRWFNCKRGDQDSYVDDHTGEEIFVDMREEFEEVCSMASLDPVLVTEVANKVYERAKEEK